MRTTSLATLSFTALASLLAATCSTAAPAPELVERAKADHGKCIAVNAANLAEEKKAIYDSKIVPDVYRSGFWPTGTVAFYYSGKFINYGQKLTMLETIPQPDVYFPAPKDDKDDTYTLVISDPDTPVGIANPQFLHWIKRGLKPNCKTPSTQGGTDVRAYLFPTPPPLLQPTEHRYVFSLLREPKKGYNPSQLQALLELRMFDVEKFEKEYNAKLVASNYFLGSAM